MVPIDSIPKPLIAERLPRRAAITPSLFGVASNRLPPFYGVGNSSQIVFGMPGAVHTSAILFRQPQSRDLTLKHHRFHELDSLRAIAALGVICWHYVNAFGASPFSTLLAPFFGRGLLMVEFFFVLSGFVLTLAFWQANRQATFTSNVIARIGRLYPLHIVTLLAVACMQWWLVSGLDSKPFVYTFNDAYHFVLNTFLVQATGLQRGWSFNAPSWSISTEFCVNVLFLGLIALPRRFAQMLALIATILGIVYLLANGVINTWRFAGLGITSACFFVGVTLYQIHARLPMQSSVLGGWLWTEIGRASCRERVL